MNTVLVIDDDPTIRDLIALGLREVEIETIAAETGREGLAALDHAPRAVVLDIGLPDISGVDVLAAIRRSHPTLPVIVITAMDDIETAVKCMRLGAHDFLQKPFESARVVTTVKNACSQKSLSNKLESVARQRKRARGFETLRGDSPALLRTLEVLQRAVGRDVTILIQGESGTGKEVLAKAIHAESDRSAGPFVPINCGAIPESLIESELFGHEKGAFTGAQSARPGLFEQAEGGVVFLDEIGELRADLQVRLLRVLQERTIKRVGSNRERVVDLRVVAATNRDLQEEVTAGRFREDLFYRLAVFPVTLPPLRERGDDVMLLAKHFLEQTCTQTGCEPAEFSKAAESALSAYAWPGNVRQLQNVIERAVILAEDDRIELHDLTDDVLAGMDDGEETSVSGPMGPRPVPRGIRLLADVEREAILEALELTEWNVSETAERLGIGRATLYRRIHQYGIERASSETSTQETGT